MKIQEAKVCKEVEKFEETVFRALTHRKFIRYRPKDELKAAIIKKIQDAIARQSPVVLVVGFGYHKNPNAATNLLPDMAEEETIKRLFELSEKVKELYPHGMEVKIITSGRRAEIVNGVKPFDTRQYHHHLTSLVSEKGWEEVVHVIPISEVYAEIWDDLQAALLKKGEEVNSEIDNLMNVDFWNSQIEYARRNINRNGLTQDEVDKKARESAAKYITFRRAEKEINFLGNKFPRSIICSYNNDSATTMKLWTLRKGYITQPWQGVAQVIDGKCHVITQSRQGK